jgi:hypothetical protein
MSLGLGRFPRGKDVNIALRKPQLGHDLIIPPRDLWRDRFRSQP